MRHGLERWSTTEVPTVRRCGQCGNSCRSRRSDSCSHPAPSRERLHERSSTRVCGTCRTAPARWPNGCEKPHPAETAHHDCRGRSHRSAHLCCRLGARSRDHPPILPAIARRGIGHRWRRDPAVLRIRTTFRCGSCGSRDFDARYATGHPLPQPGRPRARSFLARWSATRRRPRWPRSGRARIEAHGGCEEPALPRRQMPPPEVDSSHVSEVPSGRPALDHDPAPCGGVRP